jgi:hypothetical protein
MPVPQPSPRRLGAPPVSLSPPGQDPDDRQRLRREGLVHLEHVDLAGLEARQEGDFP